MATYVATLTNTGTNRREFEGFSIAGSGHIHLTRADVMKLQEKYDLTSVTGLTFAVTSALDPTDDDAAMTAIGTLSSLGTTAKTNLVAAVNEVNTNADAANTALAAVDTAVAAITALKADYATGDLDAEAEIIAALNATNTALNTVVTALQAIVADEG